MSVCSPFAVCLTIETHSCKAYYKGENSSQQGQKRCFKVRPGITAVALTANRN